MNRRLEGTGHVETPGSEQKGLRVDRPAQKFVAGLVSTPTQYCRRKR